MKLAVLLSVLYVVSSTDYGKLNKTKDIEPLEYGRQAAKDIRAIGRSYAYQLVKKQLFTDYVSSAYDIMNDTSLDGMGKGKKYAETYTIHIAAVGAGLVLAIVLGIGFCFTPLCCCCCNKTQKHEPGMALWRMIWGSILVILLAANIAGLTILAVSGSQILTLEDETTNTVTTMADSIVTYLEETDKQLETLKKNQIKTFIGEITPLVEDAIDSAITQVKADAPLSQGVTDSVASLNALDTILKTATVNVDELSTSVADLTTTLTTINTNLGTCKTEVENCNDPKCDAIDSNTFNAPFDPAIMKTSEIDDVKTNIGKLQEFPAGADAKTLAGWAAYVQEKWDNLADTTKTELNDVITNYKNMLTDAESEVVTNLEKIQEEFSKLQDTIETQNENITAQLKANLAFTKSLLLLQEGDTTNVTSALVDIKENDIFKYIPFGLFVLICVILGLLVLTVIVGLAATLFGCCTVSDDDLTTERKSGPCGTLLMCTSYCSVILCAIACLVAAILVTVVIASEGTCKQYNDDKLLDQLEKLSLTFNMSALDLGKTLEATLKLEDDSINIQEVMNSCSKSETLFSAFKIEQDTEIEIAGNFSFASLKAEVNKQVDDVDLDSAIDGMATITVMDASAKADLETNKDSLNSYDYSSIKSSVENAQFTDIPDLDSMIQNLDGVNEVKNCRDGLIEIKSKQGDASTEQSAVVDALTAMEGTATEATTKLTELLDAVTVIDGRLSHDTFVKAIVKAEADKAKTTAKTDVTEFIDWLWAEFEESVGNCQPIYSVYTTVFNYTCDGIMIHLTLLYCGMSLIGISLLFYMCVSRCLARYFIKYNRLHPEDEGGNGWTKDHSMTPVLGSGNRVGPYPGHYAQTKL